MDTGYLVDLDNLISRGEYWSEEILEEIEETHCYLSSLVGKIHEKTPRGLATLQFKSMS